MQKRKNPFGEKMFRRLFANLSHLLWVIALIDALYIAAHMLTIAFCPSQAMARGMLLCEVPPMIEHILMSVLLLSACGEMEESVFSSV